MASLFVAAALPLSLCGTRIKRIESMIPTEAQSLLALTSRCLSSLSPPLHWRCTGAPHRRTTS